MQSNASGVDHNSEIVFATGICFISEYNILGSYVLNKSNSFLSHNIQFINLLLLICPRSEYRSGLFHNWIIRLYRSPFLIGFEAKIAYNLNRV